MGRHSELRGRRPADHIDGAEPAEIELLGVRAEFRTALNPNEQTLPRRSPDIVTRLTLIYEDGRTDRCPRVLTGERG